jgi:hypothetical protein
MADGWTEADILENYPGITHEDILACLNLRARYIELGEGIPERGLICAFSPTRISLPQRSLP